MTAAAIGKALIVILAVGVIAIVFIFLNFLGVWVRAPTDPRLRQLD